MDKKSLIGLLLIGVILFGYAWYNSRQASKFAEEKAIADSIARAEGRIVERPVADQWNQDNEIPAAGIRQDETHASATDSIRRARYGSALIDAEQGTEKFYTVETELLKITFTNKGGRIANVELKDYKTYYGDPLLIAEEGSTMFDLVFPLRNMSLHTADYYFTVDEPDMHSARVEEGVYRFSMKLPVDTASYVEFLYTVAAEDYMLDFDVNFVNMDHLFSNQSTMLVEWGSTARQNEKGFQNENKYSTISYKYPGDDGLSDLGISDGSKETFVKNSLQWVAFKQQFFSTVFIADGNFMNAALNYDTFVPDSENLKKYHAELTVPFNRNDPSYRFHIYYGPNKYSLLRSYDLGMERLVPLGWSIVRWVNKWLIIPVFDLLGSRLASFGLIIFLLTLLVKIIILPLTYKSYLSTAKMRLLKPEVDAINEKFPAKEDALKKQQATMELYKRAGVNPMGGCIPMLIQLPILLALFYFFPTSIELRGESFLWADDLSSYDSILNLPFKIPFYGSHISLFTLLMAVSLIVSTKLNSQTAASSAQMGSIKFITYFMPVMFLFIFNNYASGLTYYYFISNLITMGQMWGMRYIVNDQKLHARMMSNSAKKPAKKKSKFQQKYDEMMRAQQQQQQAVRKGGNNRKKK